MIVNCRHNWKKVFELHKCKKGGPPYFKRRLVERPNPNIWSNIEDLGCISTSMVHWEDKLLNLNKNPLSPSLSPSPGVMFSQNLTNWPTTKCFLQLRNQATDFKREEQAFFFGWSNFKDGERTENEVKTMIITKFQAILRLKRKVAQSGSSLDKTDKLARADH